MSYSFLGTTIRIQNVPPNDETAAAVTTRHIPGGNVNYVDIGGQQANTLAMTLFFASYSAFLSFKANVGSYGSLVYQDGTVTALLTRLAEQARNIGSTGETTALADFTVLTPAMVANPATCPHGTNLTILLYGYATSWTGSTTASKTGGTSASIVSQSINANNQIITMTVNPGSASGTLTFANNTDALTCTVSVT